MRNTKCFVAAAFLIILFLLNNNTFFVEAYNGNIIVYVTKTGEKYHRDGCTYLKSKIPISLEKASKGYGRCSRCNPPILGQDRENDAEPYSSKWDGDSSKSSEENKSGGLASSKAEEPKDSEVLFYAKLIVPALFIILLYFGLKNYMEKREKIKLHEARCRGDLPGGVPGMPFGTIIGEDDLPRQVDSKYAWGPKYTFYVTKNGKVFHRDPRCSGWRLVAIHALYIGDRRPCKICKPMRPDLSWFMPYLNAKNNIKTLPSKTKEGNRKGEQK